MNTCWGDHIALSHILFTLLHVLCSNRYLLGSVQCIVNIYYTLNSKAGKLPIQKCMGKIAVQLKSHGESEIARN